MTDTTKTKLQAIAMAIYSFVAIVASAGALSTKVDIYIIAGSLNLICAGLGIYKHIKTNK